MLGTSETFLSTQHDFDEQEEAIDLADKPSSNLMFYRDEMFSVTSIKKQAEGPDLLSHMSWEGTVEPSSKSRLRDLEWAVARLSQPQISTEILESRNHKKRRDNCRRTVEHD